MSISTEQLSYTTLSMHLANKNSKSICQLAICVVEKGNIIYNKKFAIKPKTTNFSFTSYHGITFKNVKNAPTFDLVWKEISPYIENKNIIVFDTAKAKKQLESTLSLYNISAPKCNYISLPSLFSNLQDWSFDGLSDATDYDDVIIRGDASSNLDLYNHAVNVLAERGSTSLKKALGIKSISRKKSLTNNMASKTNSIKVSTNNPISDTSNIEKTSTKKTNKEKTSKGLFSSLFSIFKK